MTGATSMAGFYFFRNSYGKYKIPATLPYDTTDYKHLIIPVAVKSFSLKDPTQRP